MTEPIPGARLADSPNRPDGYPLDLVFVEKLVPGVGDQWHVAGAGFRDGPKEWWLGEPPGGSFEYWQEKETTATATPALTTTSVTRRLQRSWSSNASRSWLPA